MVNRNKRRLVLHLKKCWYQMIKDGIKKEEYRKRGQYYERLFHLKWIPSMSEYDKSGFDFDEVEFCMGYPRRDDTERRMVFKNPSLRFGRGRQEWGAEKDEDYFVIGWEE